MTADLVTSPETPNPLIQNQSANSRFGSGHQAGEDRWLQMLADLSGAPSVESDSTPPGRVIRSHYSEADPSADAWDAVNTVRTTNTDTMNTTTPTTLDEPADPALIQARRVYVATLSTARSLIDRGMEPASVVSALLGVVTDIGNATCGPRETRRMLMIAADANGDGA